MLLFEKIRKVIFENWISLILKLFKAKDTRQDFCFWAKELLFHVCNRSFPSPITPYLKSSTIYKMNISTTFQNNFPSKKLLWYVDDYQLNLAHYSESRNLFQKRAFCYIKRSKRPLLEEVAWSRLPSLEWKYYASFMRIS